MEANSLNRSNLTKIIRDAVVKRFNHDALLTVQEVSEGEFRLQIYNPDAGWSRYMRVKVIEEK